MSTPARTRPALDDDAAAFGGSTVKAPIPPRVEEDAVDAKPFDFDYKPVSLEISPYSRGNPDAIARAQQAINRRMEKLPGAFPLPGGRIGRVEYIAPHYRAKANWWLAEPEKLLKNPRPPESGYRYAWARKADKNGKNDADTAGYIRGGMYRAIRKSELIPDMTSSVVTHKGPGEKDEDARVYWRDTIFVEVHPEMVSQQYDEPVRESMYRVAGYRDELAADIEQISGGNAQLTQFEATDVRRE